MRFDIVVVGSGPSGAQAAKEAVESGLSVAMLDVGFDEPALAASIPERSFSELRRTDAGQRRYFLGSDGDTESDVNDRIGGHFTPPRAYIKTAVAELVPVRSSTFFPEMSLALGGLGAGWGSGSQVFEPFELERAGLPAAEMGGYYDAVARDIGISGARDDDTAGTSLPASGVFAPAAIDTNARAVFAAYGRHRDELHRRGFRLGRAALAMLTERDEAFAARGRLSNPYLDMDFYTDARRSIYRPKYTIEELRLRSNFTYIDRALVERYRAGEDGVTIGYRDLRTGSGASVEASRLLLAANPLNSARIVLRSSNAIDVKQPLLCNPYHYIPTVNLAMLGRAADDRRHSLAQLVGSYTPEHRGGEHVFAAFFSYRSLLHFRLVREMPLPPSLGLLVSRLLMNALTIVGLHHPESPSQRKWVALRSDDELEAGYELDAGERAAVASDLSGIAGVLRRLNCMPLSVIATPPGSSIHYAGTIPFASDDSGPAISCAPDGQLNACPNVFVADSSTWRYLPAKGPTLTMMANARRVARAAARELRP